MQHAGHIIASWTYRSARTGSLLEWQLLQQWQLEGKLEWQLEGQLEGQITCSQCGPGAKELRRKRHCCEVGDAHCN